MRTCAMFPSVKNPGGRARERVNLREISNVAVTKIEGSSEDFHE